jgi:hypothetical protein
MDERTILVYCCSSIFSLTSPPPTSQTKYTVYTDSVCLWGGGGGGVNCAVDHIRQEFYSVSDQIQNLQNCFTTPNKMTSEDDIKGLVSLKFFRPWSEYINCSQTHECGNWDCGHAIPFLKIFVSNFRHWFFAVVEACLKNS